MTSVCVNEKTWPTCSDPLTVGGGVSIEKTSARGRVRSNRYTPASSHRGIHLASRPSRAGFSGRRNRAGSRVVRGRGSDIRESYYKFVNWRVGNLVSWIDQLPSYQLTNFT